MHREHPLLRERGLHNQAAEGEGDKKPQADPSTHHCPQASTSQGQDLIGNRSWSSFSPAICSRWQQQAGSLLPPMSACCWETAALLSPLHPSVPGCFFDGGRAEGWKDAPSPGWQCHTVCKHLCQLSPHLQHHPLHFSCSSTTSVQPCGERPSSKFQVLTPSCFSTQKSTHKSRMKPGEQPGR